MPTVDRYATPLKLPMPVDTYWRFPNIRGYRAEYREGELVLSYQPRLNMARLRVAQREARRSAGVQIVPLDLTKSRDGLAKLFVTAFARVAPLDAMPATTRRHAADAALKHTATNGDGKVFGPACFVAADAESGELLGAVILTEISLRTDEWPGEALPETLVNLTWLYVATHRQRRGIASSLLDHAVNALAANTVPWLVSHFADDNAPATMFHWRQGFELVSWK